jgi:CHAD domain-containing protein
VSSSSTRSDIAVPATRELVISLKGAEADLRAGDPEGIHRMRVITRRLRSVLAGFRGNFDEAATADVRDRLKLLGSILGTARDLEVRAAALDAVLGELDDSVDVGPARKRVVDGSWTDFEAARERAVTYLDGDAYRRLQLGLHDLVEAGRQTHPSRTSLHKLIAHELKRTRARAKRAAAAEPGSVREFGALHDVRKAARRLRYIAEAIAANATTHRSRFLRVAETAEDVQDSLGDYRDGTLFAEFLLFESKRALAASEDTFALGAAYQEELRTAGGARAASRRALKRLNRARRAW